MSPAEHNREATFRFPTADASWDFATAAERIAQTVWSGDTVTVTYASRDAKAIRMLATGRHGRPVISTAR